MALKTLRENLDKFCFLLIPFSQLLSLLLFRNYRFAHACPRTGEDGKQAGLHMRRHEKFFFSLSSST